MGWFPSRRRFRDWLRQADLLTDFDRWDMHDRLASVTSSGRPGFAWWVDLPRVSRGLHGVGCPTPMRPVVQGMNYRRAALEDFGADMDSLAIPALRHPPWHTFLLTKTWLWWWTGFHEVGGGWWGEWG